eukprot:scaffold91955_cov73-Cyclotella_meneghiniana.AAC.4
MVWAYDRVDFVEYCGSSHADMVATAMALFVVTMDLSSSSKETRRNEPWDVGAAARETNSDL